MTAKLGLQGLLVGAVGCAWLVACGTTSSDAGRSPPPETRGKTPSAQVAAIPVADTDDPSDSDACDRMRLCMLAVIAQLPAKQRHAARQAWEQASKSLVTASPETRRRICTQALQSYAKLPNTPDQCGPEGP